MLDFAEDLWNLNPASKINRAGGGIESLDQAREPLTRKLTDELAARGLYLRRRDAIADLAIQRAGMLIRRAPLLEGVILECVQELILLQAPDEQCDVSHSEPRWPHLILVSLPPQTPVGDLRLAEAIVHEAMHLNLSFVEAHTQLIGDEHQLFSPWRLKPRPASGVLHGLYVFASLLRFFKVLQLQEGLSLEQQEHIADRCTTILHECRQVPQNELWHRLTPDGQAIAQRIFELVARQTFHKSA